MKYYKFTVIYNNGKTQNFECYEYSITRAIGELLVQIRKDGVEPLDMLRAVTITKEDVNNNSIVNNR